MDNGCKINLRLVFGIAVILVAVAGGVYLIASKNNQDINMNLNTKEKVQAKFAIMKTNFGDIKLEFFKDDAPKTVENFVNLSESGFYEGVKFHRVIKGFMLQGGDPNSKDDDWSDDGMGGPGYTFADEIHANNQNNAAAIAMANAGPNTNGSQFFINTANNNFLDAKHTVFGKVIEGMDVVLAIENVKIDKSQGDHPIEDVIINSIEIIMK